MIENSLITYKMTFVIDIKDRTNYINNSSRIQTSLEIQITTFLFMP